MLTASRTGCRWCCGRQEKKARKATKEEEERRGTRPERERDGFGHSIEREADALRRC